MFNKEFKDKKIAFLGDSILAHAYYLNDMRAFMHTQKDRCYLFNRGIGGNRADMIDCLMQDEVFAIKPDYCVICFGGNDVGVWLYDSFKEVTPELLKDREKRNESHRQGIKRFVKYCKQKGIIPILMSDYATNELLEEKPDIPTLGDNKEKADLIGPWFYKRKSFQAVNDALRGYRDFLKEYAEQEGIMFFDLFEKTYKNMREEEGLFNSDGMHFSVKGHKYVAKGVLELMGYENVPLDLNYLDVPEELRDIESLERRPAFIRFNMFNTVNGDATEEEKINACKKILADENEAEWLKASADAFLKYNGKFDELRDKYVDLVMKY